MSHCFANRLTCSKCGAQVPQRDHSTRTFRHTPRALTPTGTSSNNGSIHINEHHHGVRASSSSPHHPSAQQRSSHQSHSNHSNNSSTHSSPSSHHGHNSAVSAAHMVLSPSATSPSLTSMMAAASSAAHAQIVAAAIAATHASQYSSSSGSMSPMSPNGNGVTSPNQTTQRSGKHPGDWICPTCQDLNYNSRYVALQQCCIALLLSIHLLLLTDPIPVFACGLLRAPISINHTTIIERYVVDVVQVVQRHQCHHQHQQPQSYQHYVWCQLIKVVLVL
jgi:hypothetical protein